MSSSGVYKTNAALQDPYSPHIIKFPDSWNAPIINQIQISAFDLTLWNDVRLGASRLNPSSGHCTKQEVVSEKVSIHSNFLILMFPSSHFHGLPLPVA